MKFEKMLSLWKIASAMKRDVTLTLIFSFFLFSPLHAQISTMVNKITLDVDHPNKTRFEYFLNSVDERLEKDVFEWHSLKEANKIVAGYRFKNSDQALSITVIFADSYGDANQIAHANSFPTRPDARWSVNGDVLYLVEAKDENTVGDILSLFAGRE